MCQSVLDVDMTASNVDAKIVLLGNSFAGKTSIVERFLRNRFLGEENYQNVGDLQGIFVGVVFLLFICCLIFFLVHN